MKINESNQDLSDLKKAVSLLESPTLTARINNMIGSPIEYLVEKLPDAVQGQISSVVRAALFKSAELALWSMKNSPGQGASTKSHKFFAAISGAVGGLGGIATIAVELPVSTTIMMRSVADVARSEGFDLDDFATKEACLEVFALGGETKDDDAAETGYYAMRTFMNATINQLSKEVAEMAAKNATNVTRGFTSEQAGKWLAIIIEKIASRFGIVITEKIAAQAVPVLGAFTGAAINTMFTDFYQDMARGHFIMKRLEQKYGEEHIKEIYLKIK